MPTRDTAPMGAPCWIQLSTSDTDRSRGFYTALFGWTAEDPIAEFGGYFNFRQDDVRVAGAMGTEPGADQPDSWSLYLASDDAAKTLEAASAHGAQVIVPAMPVGDLGVMGFVVDPGGAAIGVWQPGSHPGFGIIGEHGAPGWFELHTRDYERVLDFYRNVFGWRTQVISDGPEFRYTVAVEGEEQLAGVMDGAGFLPPGAPATWSVYFGVDDADAALAKAVELGGSIVEPAMDTPYGRLAGAADPTGARFKLVAPNEAMPSRPS